MKKTLNVGLVGYGYWGPNLVRNLRTVADCRLKMVCDLDPKRLEHMQKLYPDVKGVTDYSQMLAGNAVDAVMIATSVKLHFPMAKAALEAGKHTFIEKPMASSSPNVRS